MDELRGKVAVVTGGASGIGRAMATRFVAEGMQVVVADVERPALDQAVHDLGGPDAGVFGVLTDVSKGESVEALAAATLDRFGRVDVVCNNAGVAGGGGPIWEVTQDDWAWTLNVNLWGVVHGVRVFTPLLLAQGTGHIVNTASAAGVIAGPLLGAYSVSKHAVVALSETLACDLAMSGSKVGVSVLCPGFVRTNLADGDRNRPDELGDTNTAAAGTREFLRLLLDAGIDPAEVADGVADAIKADRFYIYTHPHLMAGIESRAAAVVAGEGPPPMAQLF
jgi:NAD(P)-dependent dehydrogenase (short-subunit alcohol dehydrogenase family)